MRDTSKVLIILSISFLLVVLEDSLDNVHHFSALIAIMFIGIGLQRKREAVAKKAVGKIWETVGRGRGVSVCAGGGQQ